MPASCSLLGGFGAEVTRLYQLMLLPRQGHVPEIRTQMQAYARHLMGVHFPEEGLTSQLFQEPKSPLYTMQL